MTTRGSSKLGTSTRVERDAIVQVWIPRSDLATIGYYMENKGFRILHMSDILKFAVETTRAICLKANSPYLETSVATKFLEDRCRINLNPNDKAKKNLVSNLLLESGYMEGSEIVPEPPKPKVDENTIADIKLRAKEAFRTDNHSLTTDREEKDKEVAEKEKLAFDALIKK